MGREGRGLCVSGEMVKAGERFYAPCPRKLKIQEKYFSFSWQGLLTGYHVSPIHRAGSLSNALAGFDRSSEQVRYLGRPGLLPWMDAAADQRL